MKKVFFVLLMALNSYIIKAQLVIDNSTQTPQELAQNVLLGQGVTISNIKFNNFAPTATTKYDQIGQFSNGATTNIGIDKGIILSTGNSLIAKGPNDQDKATLPTSNSFIGDNDLKILSNNQTIKSVAILEFDFVPTGNKLNFNFVFASEEYPEFVNETYNDNFGFFLSGPGITGPFSGNATNIALIPNTSLPVSINNLNNGLSNSGPCEYCQYYINNESGTTIQYDGFTKVIGAIADVQCGQTYHIKLAIANVGDDNYDSAVFIEGASFSSEGINLGKDLNLCSVTQHKLDTGLDASIVHQWTLDGQIISNESGPSITIDKSGTYGVKATPLGTACPASDEIKVGFNTVKIPVLSCGTKTANSQQFNWLPIPTVTDYSISYRIGINPEIQIGAVGNVNSYTVSGVALGETVLIKVTPIGGTPTDCYGSNSISCILDNCLDSPTINLNQGATYQQICESTAISDIIFTIGGGATNASITSGSLPTGVTTSLVGDQFIIKGIATATGLFNYSISTSGGCGASASLSGAITVNQKTNPAFTVTTSICIGETITALPTISSNSISGSWSPALNNLATTEYTFTPNIGQCAHPAKLTITVNSKITPVFNTVAPICAGETIAALPTISNNSISGSWIPALNNLTTTEYTFTPNIGQCAIPTKLTITVNSAAITPTFNAVTPICAGETIAALPTISNNSISGSWNPALNNLTTTEYTFTPSIGQCAKPTKLTISVNSKTTPTFNAVAPICAGETIAALPTTSNNSISGKWTPAVDNLKTTEYTFTPNLGLCANPAKLTITINPKVIPLFKAVAPICAGETIAVLPTISNNSISGKWNPTLDNLKTTEYTFTPNIGQCANVTKLTITVNSKTTPIFNAVNSICAGETIAVLPTTSNNGIQGKWNPALDNLKTTEYTFTPNIGQCANSTKLTIRVNPKPIPSLADGMICKDKTTNAIIKSYILDSNLNPTDYNFEWFLDGKTIINATRNTLEPIEKGVYSVIATNKITKCSSAQIEATISENLIDAASIKIEQTNSFSNAATITIAIIPATGIYEYQLDNGTFQTASVFSEVAAGSHIINIVDVTGCYNVSKEIIVLGYPKFFTPNGDGINDTWNIIGFTARYNPIVYIFDRFGKLLKQMASKSNGWDGTYNGHPMPSDDYWFTVQFLEDGIPKEFRSHFSLKR